MKKIITILVFTLITSVGFSQVNYGIRAALNVSNLDFDPDATFNNQHRNGFAFGGFVEYGVGDTVSILTELQWSAEGAKADELRADYLNLPVMLRLNFGNLTAGIGPQASLKIWENEDAFSTFSFSGVAGLEYMITDEIFIDARYSYGIANVLNEDTVGNDIEAKNTNIQFGVGIKL